MIADELIEEIRAQVDIVDVIGEHVRLRRSGRTFRGPCPLHGGEGPNFSVDPERGIFKCFVCGEGGDVFTFLMEHLGLEFVEAVRLAGERCGIHVPERRSRREEEDPHRDLREAVAFAERWFQTRLRETEAGERARRYLVDERELPEEAIERFGLGYAPDSWRALREAAAVHEIPEEVLLRTGLIKESERASEPYDLFRGRLIFPIYDLRNRVIGFGGRLVDGSDEAPKYINSSDSPIFHKGRVIYGLNWSRHEIRRGEVALIVEGYMDLISLAARGVEGVVAPLGTALTPEQARAIARYAKRALLLYDSDKAGLRATFRAADELLRAGVHPSVVTLPDGEDPDSLVRRDGPAGLRPYTDDAVDVIDRKIQILEERGYLDSIEGRRRAVDALLPTVRAASDAALRDIYLDRVASVTGVRLPTLRRELVREPRSSRRRRRAGPAEPRGEALPRLGPEWKLLLLLVRDRSLVPRVSELVEAEDFRVPELREIYLALQRADAGPEPEDADEPLDWARDLPGPAFEVARELEADPEELTDPETVLRDAVDRLGERRSERQLSELVNEMLVDEDESTRAERLREIHRVKREQVARGGRGNWRRLFKTE